jgi:hypothetical protein
MSEANGLISDDAQRAVRREVRSPRSAAIAGIIYALLTGASMILLWGAVNADPAEMSGEWLEAWSGKATVVLLLIPFAGFAFLWFTGVMRDLLGDLEDKFFATVFLGTGILVVGLMYVWAAAFGAIFGTYALAADLLADYDVFVYALVFVSEIINSFALRAEGMYMLSIGLLWTTTKVVPSWLSIITIIVSVPFLLFAAFISVAPFVFPAWVLLVSVYILILNYRFTQKHEGKEELSFDK